MRLKVDWREETPGYKFNDWELKGVPLRMEVGPKDVQKGQAVLARRDTREKAFVPVAELAARVPTLLDEIQRDMFQRALDFRLARTRRLDSYDELLAAFQGEDGNVFVEAHWCGDAACEARVKDETKATIRNVPFDAPREEGACIVDGKPGLGQRVVFAKAY